jgi:putative transposase
VPGRLSEFDLSGSPPRGVSCEPTKANNHTIPMEDYRSLSHTKWQCKYHIVFIPKYRRRTLFGVVRRELGPVFRRLAQQKECWIEEGHILPDPVHMLLSIPPKLAVSSVVGYLKGKSAIHVARHFLRRERNYAGQHLWHEGSSWIR